MRVSSTAIVVVLSLVSRATLADNFALQFEGKRSGATVGNPMVNAGQVLTWEAWLQPTSAPSNCRILYHRAHYSDKSLGFSVLGAGRGEAAFGFLAGTATGVSDKSAGATITYPAGSWIHLAGSYDGEYLRLYVNGRFLAKTYAPEFNGYLNWTDNYFGTFVGTNLREEEPPYFRGLIDEVRVWSSVRTEEEIAAGMNLRVTGPQAGLLAVYSFDEDSGQKILNGIGNRYNGFLGAEALDDSYDAIRTRSTAPLNYLDVSRISPQPCTTAGALLTVEGKLFQTPAVTTVMFDGKPVIPDVLDDVHIIFPAPPHLDGEIRLEIRNPIGYVSTRVIYHSEFIRGDATGEGRMDVSDAIKILSHLFLGGVADCRDAFDANDSGELDISDGVSVLAFLFQGGNRPPEPFLTRGPDPTDDGLYCGR